MHLLHSNGFNPSPFNSRGGYFLKSMGAVPGHRPKFNNQGVGAQDSLQFLQASLQKHLQPFSAKSVPPVTETQKPALSAETVANNILGFIEQRLKKEQAEGASSEELAERLEQGLSGFKKGFAEAKEKLSALGMLTNNIEEDIGKTYDLVVGGIDDLRALFVEQQPAESDKVEKSNREVVDRIGGSALSASYGQISYGLSNNFNFEVETANGDVVSISARSKQLYAAEYRASTYASAGSAGAFERFESYSSQSSRFTLQVNGELDEDELQALDQLLGKVEDLANDFFAGDLDSAMQQALNLGYDTEEIVGYSLNLRQTEVQRVAVAYQQVGPAAAAINPLADRLQPLGNFARELLDAINIGESFADPSRLLADLSEQVDVNPLDHADAFAEKPQFSQFMKQMLDALPARS